MHDVPQDDPELVAILGPNMTAQLSQPARNSVKTSADAHPQGVARIAREVLRDPSIRNPVGVLLDRLSRGQHLDAEPRPSSSWATPRPLGPQPCPTCGQPPYGYRPVTDGCRTCGRPNTTNTEQERNP